MNIRKPLIDIASAALLLLTGAGAACAGQVLYDASGFIVGQQSFSDSFDLSGPGTLTITLTNMSWPDPLASLNSVVSTSQGLLGAPMSSGTQTFDVSGGPVFVQWYGSGQGLLDAGVYGLNIQYQASSQPAGGGPNPVPLPTSIALFFSGLLLLAWHRRAKATAPGTPARAS